jgi:hypothetical protein
MCSGGATWMGVGLQRELRRRCRHPPQASGFEDERPETENRSRNNDAHVATIVSGLERRAELTFILSALAPKGALPDY